MKEPTADAAENPSSDHFLIITISAHRMLDERRGEAEDLKRDSVVERRENIHSLCSPAVKYAIIVKYGTHNLNRAQLCVFFIERIIDF